MSGDEGDRTPDLGVANAALSHLSYIPTMMMPLHIRSINSGQLKNEQENTNAVQGYS